MVKKISFRFFSCCFICFCLASQIAGQRPILDEFGNETGLINMNPDPNGEPWIAGGVSPLTAEQMKRHAQIPELEVPEEILTRQLPSSVVLVDDPEFPPIFNQVGGSCGQASGIGYLYSYQVNVCMDITATSDNTRAYGFTYNFLNGGSNSNGSWYADGWDILETVGCPTAETFHGSLDGGLSGTRWMNGYDRWHTANDNRVIEQFRWTISSMADIDKLKNWFYDQIGENPNQKGACVVFAANAGTATSNSTVQSGVHAGEPLCTHMSGSNMNHAMTLAGYDDDAQAVLLVNSWGTRFENNGTLWVSYNNLLNGGLYRDEVQGVRVAKNEPKLECRATISHNSREDLRITTGFSSNISASSPSETKSYARAFNRRGGSLPMEGRGGSEEIEIGLDVSEFYDMITGDEAKIFLVIESSGGSGQVARFSVMDCSGGGTPQEFVCDQQNVTISGTITLSVIISSQPRITVISPNGDEVWEQNTPRTITWGDNIDDNVKIELYKGGSLNTVLASSTESDGEFEWTVPENQEPGNDYTVKITCVTNDTLTDESNAAFTIEEEFVIDQFPYVEPFDDLDTGKYTLPEKWEQLAADNLDWLVLSGPTPSKVGSSPDITGPDGDHTSGNGNYIYVEASGDNSPSKMADFVTPKFNLRNLANPELSFWCHMFSANDEMGDLYCDIYVDGTWQNDVIHLTDDHGDAWFEVKQDLSTYVGDRVIFRFRGITGATWASDICIDDFMVDGATRVIDKVKESPRTYNLSSYGSCITFSIPERNGTQLPVSIKLYSIQGKVMRTLVQGPVEAGHHTIRINTHTTGHRLAAGLYLCRMETKGFSKTVNVIVK